MNSAALAVLPSVREWTPREGQCLITPNSRLIVDARSAAMIQLVRLFQIRLQRVTGIIFPLLTGISPAAGDISLLLVETGAGDQGYVLDIRDSVTLRADSTTGLFYGTQTLLQLLLQSAARCTLPAGTVRDFPDYAERAVMLDLGRRYWSPDALIDLIERMAWFKLNVLHLHFSEWSAFRLQSKQYPGLAPDESYSRAEIAMLEAFARAYHVLIVPEIDLPAHAAALTHYRPELAFDCPSMSYSRWAGGEQGGWTINYTSPEARAWMRDLVGVFIRWFEGRYFHIGTDEVPERESLSECPALVNYAHQRGYAHPGDVLVEWINEMNALVKSQGKQLQIWNWWERSPHSIEPDRDIVINAWVGQGEPARFLQAGYSVIGSPEDTHYVSPGIHLLPDADHLHQRWQPDPHPNMLGYKLCVWADQAEHHSDAFFEAQMRLPRAVLAERTWNRAVPAAPLADFNQRFETFDSALPLINLRMDRRAREIVGLEPATRIGAH